MSEASPAARKRERLADYLREQVRNGSMYFKSSSIAQDLGMTSKEVGANLVFLEQELDDLKIKQWGNSKSTTWLIESTN